MVGEIDMQGKKLMGQALTLHFGERARIARANVT